MNMDSLLPLRDCDRVLVDEDDFGMEQGSGYAGDDGDEVALSVEDFDVAGAGEFGKVDGASAADAGGGGFVGGDAGKLRQQLTGMDEEGRDDVRKSRFLHSASLALREGEAPVGMTICSEVGMTIPYLVFNFFQGVSLADIELCDSGAAEGFEMGSAAK